MDNMTEQYYWHDCIDECADQEITSREFEDLDKFLRTKAGDCTNLSMADGFITAMLIGPYAIPREQDQWLQSIWGDNSATLFYKKAPTHERKMLDILYRHLSNIYYQLEHDRAGYEPFVGSRYHRTCVSNGSSDGPAVVDWCRGFVKFYSIYPEAWVSITQSESGRYLIAPFIYFGSANGWTKKVDRKSDMASYQGTFAYFLPHFVFAIKDYFLTPHYVEEMKELVDILSPHWTIPETYSIPKSE